MITLRESEALYVGGWLVEDLKRLNGGIIPDKIFSLVEFVFSFAVGMLSPLTRAAASWTENYGKEYESEGNGGSNLKRVGELSLHGTHGEDVLVPLQRYKE